jgi:flagellar biosynthetic protein FliO
MPDDTILKAFLSLITMVAAFAAILFVIKKIVVKNKQGVPGSDLKILSRIHLQPKANLYVVQAGDKKMIIGVTDHNVTAIGEIQDQQAIISGESHSSVPMNYKIHQKANSATKSQSIQTNVPNRAIENANPLSFKSFIASAFKRNVN